VYAQKVAGFESELMRKIKSKKLESPFEWKANIKTPVNPFRAKQEKVSGKITNEKEENAFLKLTSQREIDNKHNFRSLTLYPSFKNTDGSISQRILSTYEKVTGHKTKNEPFQPSQSSLEIIKNKRKDYLAKKLPEIKLKRNEKMMKWRKSRHFSQNSRN
jgi:hypothetical protein